MYLFPVAMALRPTPSHLSLAAVVALFAPACANPAAAVGPARAPSYEPDQQSKSRVRANPLEPLVIEWPAAARAQLEAQTRHGVVAVRYDGSTMEVLPTCHLAGGYTYAGTNVHKDRLVIADADQLAAELPLGVASLSGKLAQAGRLEVSLTVVGSYELDRDSVDLDDSDGCKRATHVVSTLSAGAFELSSGGESDAAAGVGVGNAGIRAEKQSRREVLNRAGDESACEAARSGDATPPSGCGALLRVVLRPARRPKPAVTTASPAPTATDAPKEPPGAGATPKGEPTPAREPGGEPAKPERPLGPVVDEPRPLPPVEPARPEPAPGMSTAGKVGVGVGVALLVGALVAGIVVGATRDTTTKHTAAPTGGLGSAKLSTPAWIRW